MAKAVGLSQSHLASRKEYHHQIRQAVNETKEQQRPDRSRGKGGPPVTPPHGGGEQGRVLRALVGGGGCPVMASQQVSRSAASGRFVSVPYSSRRMPRQATVFALPSPSTTLCYSAVGRHSDSARYASVSRERQGVTR